MTADADHGKRKPFSLASGFSLAMRISSSMIRILGLVIRSTRFAVDGLRERDLYCRSVISLQLDGTVRLPARSLTNFKPESWSLAGQNPPANPRRHRVRSA